MAYHDYYRRKLQDALNELGPFLPLVNQRGFLNAETRALVVEYIVPDTTGWNAYPPLGPLRDDPVLPYDHHHWMLYNLYHSGFSADGEPEDMAIARLTARLSSLLDSANFQEGVIARMRERFLFLQRNMDALVLALTQWGNFAAARVAGRTSVKVVCENMMDTKGSPLAIVPHPGTKHFLWQYMY